MPLTPSNKTAALAGIWSGVGMTLHEAWVFHHEASYSVAAHNTSSLLAALVFFVAPGYFLVLGHGVVAFDRSWFLDPEQRARYYVVVRRMWSWFLAAGVTMALTFALLP